MQSIKWLRDYVVQSDIVNSMSMGSVTVGTSFLSKEVITQRFFSFILNIYIIILNKNQ